MTSYNLAQEAWIPCINTRGAPEVLGLREIAARAYELRDLAIISPVARVAVYRLLLSILYRVHGVVDDDAWIKFQKTGWQAEPLLNYIDRWKNRFDLYDSQYPFYQRTDIRTRDTPLTKLSPEYAAGDNRQLADHSMDYDPPRFSPAEAARALLAFQAWAISCGNGPEGRYTVTTQLARGACVMPLGSTLAETLYMNLVPRWHLDAHPRNMPAALPENDLPAWERAGEPMVDERHCTGICDYLTWQIRYVRLHPESDGCVKFMDMAQGVRLANKIIDPHHAWVTSEKNSIYPCGLSNDRATWRDSESLFVQSDRADAHSSAPLAYISHQINGSEFFGASLRTVLVAGLVVPGGQPPVEGWCADVFRIPRTLLESREQNEIMRKALHVANDVAKVLYSALYVYSHALLTPENGKPDEKDVKRQIKALSRETYYWAALEAPFHKLLIEIEKLGCDHAYAGWVKSVRESAIIAYDASLSGQVATGRQFKARSVADCMFWSPKKGIPSILLVHNQRQEATCETGTA
jgi:CRISPR system Cascade subunit CasA